MDVLSLAIGGGIVARRIRVSLVEAGTTRRVALPAFGDAWHGRLNPYPLEMRTLHFWACWAVGGLVALGFVFLVKRCCTRVPTHRARRHGARIDLIDHTFRLEDEPLRTFGWMAVDKPLRSRSAVNQWADACVSSLLCAPAQSTAYVVVNHC